MMQVSFALVVRHDTDLSAYAGVALSASLLISLFPFLVMYQASCYYNQLHFVRSHANLWVEFHWSDVLLIGYPCTVHRNRMRHSSATSLTLGSIAASLALVTGVNAD
jgi:hypothetical protein